MVNEIIAIKNLSRRFGKKVALDDVSLSVPAGVVFGLVGENGAGKTTLIKHVLGMLKPQQGSVAVFGLDPVEDPVGVLGQIGYLSEDRDLPEWMRVGELMSYNRAFFSQWDEKFAGELCEMFELDLRQRVKRLSRGQRARAGLLIALAHRPKLLVLDEPSSGLDPIVRRDILSAIIRTVADEGRNVLFSSHLLDEVERVADNVAMIYQGRMVLCDSLNNVVGSHCRMTLRFAEPQDSPPALSGAIHLSGDGHEWSAICNGEMEALRRAANEAAATIVEEAPATLDEIFFARAKSATADSAK